MKFTRAVASLLGLPEVNVMNISQEELEQKCIDKLEKINCTSEANARHHRYLEDTYDMSERERKQYLDSWNGGS